MAFYLLQGSYTPEGSANLLKNPQNRFEAVRPAVEQLGGRIEGAWLAFGDYDFVVIAQLPDNVSAAAFSMAVWAGGGVKAFKTTPLLTAEEGMEAMRRGAGAGYRPPSG